MQAHYHPAAWCSTTVFFYLRANQKHFLLWTEDSAPYYWERTEHCPLAERYFLMQIWHLNLTYLLFEQKIVSTMMKQSRPVVLLSTPRRRRVNAEANPLHIESLRLSQRLVTSLGINVHSGLSLVHSGPSRAVQRSFLGADGSIKEATFDDPAVAGKSAITYTFGMLYRKCF